MAAGLPAYSAPPECLSIARQKKPGGAVMLLLKKFVVYTTRKRDRLSSVRILSILCFTIFLLVLASCTIDPNWDIRTSHDEPGMQISLVWDPNIEPDLEGYKCYYGLNSRDYTHTVVVGNQTVCTVTDLKPGETYYFAVTAYNTVGLESDYSEEIIYTIPAEL
jgi:fibronectin type 3 domain-containing protein